MPSLGFLQVLVGAIEGVSQSRGSGVGEQRPGGDSESTGACGRARWGRCGGAWKQAPKGPGRGRPRELSPDRLQVLLQVLIILTGNYNFFNLLTLVLTTALLDDTHLAAKSSTSRRKRMPSCECPPAPDRQPCCPPSDLALPQPPGCRPPSPAPSRPMTILACSLAQGPAGHADPAAGVGRLRAAGLWHGALLRPGGGLGAACRSFQNQ